LTGGRRGDKRPLHKQPELTIIGNIEVRRPNRAILLCSNALGDICLGRAQCDEILC
jgi:hypothetical protein